MTSRMPYDTIDPEVEQVNRVAVGHHDVRDKALVGFMRNRRFKKQLADPARRAISHRFLAAVEIRVVLMRQNGRTRQCAHALGATGVVSMGVRDDDQLDVAKRQAVFGENLADLGLRSGNAGVNEYAACLAADEMGVDHAERQDRNSNDLSLKHGVILGNRRVELHEAYRGGGAMIMTAMPFHTF